jgi:hypothetical protein
VSRIELNRRLQILLRCIEILQLQMRHAKLRIRQRIVRPASHSLLVISERLLRSPEVQQHAAKIDQRLESFGVGAERSSKIRLSRGVSLRLIRDRAQLVPGCDKLRSDLNCACQVAGCAV